MLGLRIRGGFSGKQIGESMSQKRQQLIETAIKLFAEHGFHATGIDRIAEVAGVTKKTLYNHFRSKEELILAALKHHDGLFRNFFMKSVSQRSSDPYERLLAIYDVAHDWFAREDFFGCIFINAISEYAHRNQAIQETCQNYKGLILSYIEELATSAQVKDPQALAQALGLLLEGSIVTAQVTGNSDSAVTAKAAARVLLNNALQHHDVG